MRRRKLLRRSNQNSRHARSLRFNHRAMSVPRRRRVRNNRHRLRALRNGRRRRLYPRSACHRRRHQPRQQYPRPRQRRSLRRPCHLLSLPAHRRRCKAISRPTEPFRPRRRLKQRHRHRTCRRGIEHRRRHPAPMPQLPTVRRPHRGHRADHQQPFHRRLKQLHHHLTCRREVARRQRHHAAMLRLQIRLQTVHRQQWGHRAHHQQQLQRE